LSNLVKVEVVKVDRDKLKQLKFPLFVPKTSDPMTDKEILEQVKAVNVGDFVILPGGATYRRVRGGFRKVTDEDLSELLASQLGGG